MTRGRTRLGRCTTLILRGVVGPRRRDRRSRRDRIERMSCTRNRVTVLRLQGLGTHRCVRANWVSGGGIANSQLIFHLRTGYPWAVKLLSRIGVGSGRPVIGLWRILEGSVLRAHSVPVLNSFKPRQTFCFILLGLAPLLPELFEFCSKFQTLDLHFRRK